MTDATVMTWGQSVLSYLKTTASTHLVIIGLGVGGFIGFRAYLSEHDARLIADATVKTAQTAIVGLQAQQVTVAKQATAQVIVLKQEAVTTPAQAVAALEAPKADVKEMVTPLDVQALPDAPGRVSVAALPLEQAVSSCAINSVNLGACTATLGLQKQIDTEKDVQITALKKKPGFWATFKKDAITVGIGVGIGYALHSK